MKECTKCGTVKDESMFAVHRRASDGRQSHCKDCNKKYRQKNRSRIVAYLGDYRARNAEDLRAFDRGRADGRRVQKREAEKVRRALHRDEIATKDKERKAKRPREEYARKEAWRAIDEGRLVRQPCEACGDEKVDAHHDDYSRPLEVRWLCRKHHTLHHADERIKEKETA